MQSVALHLAIAESPCAAALGIEPDEPLGALANLAQAPVMRQVVVVARVAQNDHGGAPVDRADMVTHKGAEGVTEIRMGVHVYNITAERRVESLVEIAIAKLGRDLADLGDEHVAAHARIEVLQRIDELQHEA